MVSGNKNAFLALKENKSGVVAIYLQLTRGCRERLRRYRREAIRDDALVSRDFEFTVVSSFADKWNEELFTPTRDTRPLIIEFDRCPKFTSLENVLRTRVWSTKEGASFTITHSVDGKTERAATPTIEWSSLYITRGQL